MGYELYITRQDNWFEEDIERKISIDEWKDYVANDAEMKLEDHTEANLDKKEVLNTSDGGEISLVGYSGSNAACFYYYKGNICAKSPDDETIKKMIKIAITLNARVQGDDMEFYGE